MKTNGLMIFFPIGTFIVTSYILLSWNKETTLVKSNFLSSQMVSHSFSPSSLPLHKAKWVQLNGKKLQVLKTSLLVLVFCLGLILPVNVTKVVRFFFRHESNWTYVASFVATHSLWQYDICTKVGCWGYCDTLNWSTSRSGCTVQ